MNAAPISPDNLAPGGATRRPFVPITVSPSHPLSYFTNNPVGPEGPGDNGDAD
jgi:hypothetical protein